MNRKSNHSACCLAGLVALAAACQQPVALADTVLVYRVDQPTKEGASAMMSEIVARRLKERGLPGSKVEVNKDGRIVVTLKTNDAKTIEVQKTLVSGPETFELRILANPLNENHAAIIRLASDTDIVEVKSSDKVVARWVPFSVPQIAKGVATRKSKQRTDEALAICGPSDLDSTCVASAKPDFDQAGKPSLDFELTTHGAELMGELTSTNLPDPTKGISYQLGVIFDGQLKTAAAIRSTITSRGRITGNFKPEEVKSMADLFNSGSHPLPITLERESQTDSAGQR